MAAVRARGPRCRVPVGAEHRAARQADMVIEQLNHALQSRIAIEQAKGVIAERAQLDMDQAFAWLRQHARSRNQLLLEVAQGVIDGNVTPEPVLRMRPTRP